MEWDDTKLDIPGGDLEPWLLETYQMFGKELEAHGNRADFSAIRQRLMNAGMSELQADIHLKVILAFYQNQVTNRVDGDTKAQSSPTYYTQDPLE